YELDILAAERMAVPRGEIPERHPESATDFCVQLMHSACKAVGRQPLGQRIRLKERAINLFRSGCQDTMQTDGVRHGYFSLRAGRLNVRRLVSRNSPSTGCRTCRLTCQTGAPRRFLRSAS